MKLLETLDLRERLEFAIELQREVLATLQVRKRIREDVEEGAQKQQREYILRRQMDSIRKGSATTTHRSSRSTEEDRGRAARERARAGRARALALRAHGRAGPGHR